MFCCAFHTIRNPVSATENSKETYATLGQFCAQIAAIMEGVPNKYTSVFLLELSMGQNLLAPSRFNCGNGDRLA